MRLSVSGMSGNELFCLATKGLSPGEIAVGNSVFSLGLGGALSAFGQALAGGELANLSRLISEGRQKRSSDSVRPIAPRCYDCVRAVSKAGRANHFRTASRPKYYCSESSAGSIRRRF